MDSLINYIIEIGGIVSIVVILSVLITKYIVEKMINRKFEKSMEEFKLSQGKELKQFESDLLVHQEYLKGVIKNQQSYFPGIGKAVYKTKNLIRDLVNSRVQNPELRSELGDQSLFIVEKLYEAKTFLPEKLFNKVHSYKQYLQNFITTYDNAVLIRDAKKKEKNFQELLLDFNSIKELSEEISKDISLHLKVNPKDEN
jgi:hypothetical protein